MKQTILILMLLLALTGCLKEGVDGCPDYIRLTFLHNNSSESFDREIGNDVYLCLYQDDKFYTPITIPYEEISGGKEYLIRKEVVGEMDIVAWALPSGQDNVEDLTAVNGSDVRSQTSIVMRLTTDGYHQAMEHLYLGTESYEDSDITQESVHAISMMSCICQFYAIMNPDTEVNKASSTDQDWFFEIYGTKSEMDLDFQPKGDDAVVKAALELDTQDDILKSGMQGLLPSGENQYVTIDAYKNGDHVFTFNTRQQARPGEVIYLEIVRGTVTVFINNWQVYKGVVEWI